MTMTGSRTMTTTDCKHPDQYDPDKKAWVPGSCVKCITNNKENRK